MFVSLHLLSASHFAGGMLYFSFGSRAAEGINSASSPLFVTEQTLARRAPIGRVRAISRSRFELYQVARPSIPLRNQGLKLPGAGEALRHNTHGREQQTAGQPRLARHSRHWPRWRPLFGQIRLRLAQLAKLLRSLGEKWYSRVDSNRRPPDPQSGALTN